MEGTQAQILAGAACPDAAVPQVCHRLLPQPDDLSAPQPAPVLGASHFQGDFHCGNTPAGFGRSGTCAQSGKHASKASLQGSLGGNYVWYGKNICRVPSMLACRFELADKLYHLIHLVASIVLKPHLCHSFATGSMAEGLRIAGN